MTLKKHLSLSAGILIVTVMTIAGITVFFLNSLNQLSTESSRDIVIRSQALDAKYHIVQIQQFLTDASVTGDRDGINNAQNELTSLEKSLQVILTQDLTFSSEVEIVRREARQLFEVGVQMVDAYLEKGRTAGNELMKRPETGLDALSEKLAADMDLLEQHATSRQLASNEAMLSKHASLLWQTVFLSLFELIVLIAIFRSLSRRTQPLDSVLGNLNQSAEEIGNVSATISSSANALSSANLQQSSATQQTAASLEQIRAMIGKTAENSQFLQTKAEETNHSVSSGKVALDEVIRIIREIDQSQKNIVSTTEKTNQEIAKIVDLVAEIGNKTKVINEIVFQTKLLSFNASVEAARAGEHGRGFAVVAEEVGSLAQMSGAASEEISAMLESSIEKVKSIVGEGQKLLAATMADSLEKIEKGVTTAYQCGEAFETIVEQMSAVNSTVSHTHGAIQETVKGLDEISRALDNLNESTRSNAETSTQTSSSGETLVHQLKQLRESIQNINHVISG